MSRYARNGPYAMWHIVSGTVPPFGIEQTFCGRYGFNYAMIPAERTNDRPDEQGTCLGCLRGQRHAANVPHTGGGIPVSSARLGTGLRRY